VTVLGWNGRSMGLGAWLGMGAQRRGPVAVVETNAVKRSG
jgi:hypothetical protein